MNLQIIFNNQVFFAGSEVTGHVEVHVNERTSAERIIFKVKGKIKTKVTIPRASGHGVDLYVNLQRILWEGTEMSPGKQRFPFRFMLAPNCPASGVIGRNANAWITYSAKVELIRPRCHSNSKKKVLFVVRPLVDLNCFPTNRMAISYSIIDQDVNGNIRLSRTGFTTGENIRVELTLHNNSIGPIEGVLLELIRCSRVLARRVEKFVAMQGQIINPRSNSCSDFEMGRTITESVATNMIDIKLAGWSSNVYDLILPLPLRMPCTSDTSPILQVTIYVHRSIFNREIVKNIPLVIGTIPYRPNPHLPMHRR